MIDASQEAGPSATAAGWQPPRTGNLVLGGYCLHKRLGAGGMGAVFLAEHAETGQRAAIKVLHDENDTAALTQRFVAEARALAQLDHPNVVKLLHFATEGSTRFLVMGFVDGVPLSERVARGPLPFDEVRRVLRSLLAALEHAHSRGVLHRDVKPANIVTDERGRVVLVDFGIAAGAAIPGVTRDDMIVGTPEYLSPERIRQQTVDERTDLYAVGVVLFEMLTGTRPFQRDTPIATVCAQLEDPTPDPSARRGEPIPDDLHNLVTSLLAKDPGERPSSAAAAAVAIADARAPRILGLLAEVTQPMTTSSLVQRPERTEDTEIVKRPARPARAAGAAVEQRAPDDRVPEMDELLRTVRRSRRLALAGLAAVGCLLVGISIGIMPPGDEPSAAPSTTAARPPPAIQTATPPSAVTSVATATTAARTPPTRSSPTIDRTVGAPSQAPAHPTPSRIVHAESVPPSPPVAQGAVRERLTDLQLRAVMDSAAVRSQVRGCYDATVTGGGAGEVAVEARVETNGDVTYARATSQTIGGGRFARCIEKVALRWRFPRFRVPNPMIVRQRFSLAPR